MFVDFCLFLCGTWRLIRGKVFFKRVVGNEISFNICLVGVFEGWIRTGFWWFLCFWIVSQEMALERWLSLSPFLVLPWFLELCCLRECFCLKTHGNSPNLNSKNMARRHRRTCNYTAEKNSCSLSLFCWAPWPQSIRLFFSVNCWRGSIIGLFFNLKGMSGVANFLLRWRCFSCVLPCFASFNGVLPSRCGVEVATKTALRCLSIQIRHNRMLLWLVVPTRRRNSEEFGLLLVFLRRAIFSLPNLLRISFRV